MYSRPFYRSARLRHFAGGAAASFLVLTFLLGFVGCERDFTERNARGVDVEVDVRPAPCDSTMYQEPPVSERREVDPTGNVRVKVTVRTCCCCCGEPQASARTGFVPPVPITGTGPGGGAPPPTRITPPTDIPELPELPPIASLPPTPAPPVQTLPPVGSGFPGGVPAVPPIAPPVQASIPWWLGLLGAPLLLFTVGDNDGVICGTDSGLPLGPNRPRC